jgi:hypothetical protein
MGEPCVEGCFPWFNSELSRDVDDVWRRASPRERWGPVSPEVPVWVACPDLGVICELELVSDTRMELLDSFPSNRLDQETKILLGF